jgi:two-component system KDP operon response regulator KdpE
VSSEPGAIQGPRILLTTSDPRFRQGFSTYLACEGFAVQTAADCAGCLQSFYAWPPDLVLCDHDPPGLDGLELCRRLRPVSNIPVLLTARGSNGNGNGTRKAEALNAGADDYLHPADPDDVVAAVRALLRRASPNHRTPDMPLEAGDFRVVEATHRCVVRGQDVCLTTQELALLCHLLKAPYRVFTHEELLRAVWGEERAGKPEFLRPLVLQLRKKIEPDRRRPIYILTEYKIGYRFNPGGGERRVA